MGAADRRHELTKVLCRRRHESISNLATEFGVSPRTIQRDIVALSTSIPVYTKPGKHGGGVYILDDFVMERMYMSAQEIALLKKLRLAAERDSALVNADELSLLQSLISQYTQPKTAKERKSS